MVSGTFTRWIVDTRKRKKNELHNSVHNQRYQSQFGRAERKTSTPSCRKTIRHNSFRLFSHCLARRRCASIFQSRKRSARRRRVNSNETEETGPIQSSIWDTRTRENCSWCPYCKCWLRNTAFAWVKEEAMLAYHQRQYCKTAPTYLGDNA